MTICFSPNKSTHRPPVSKCFQENHWTQGSRGVCCYELCKCLRVTSLLHLLLRPVSDDAARQAAISLHRCLMRSQMQLLGSAWYDLRDLPARISFLNGHLSTANSSRPPFFCFFRDVNKIFSVGTNSCLRKSGAWPQEIGPARRTASM